MQFRRCRRSFRGIGTGDEEILDLLLHFIIDNILFPQFVHDSFVGVADFDELAKYCLDLRVQKLIFHDRAGTL